VASQDIPITVKAWTSWVNGHGGVGGHPVKVSVFDDRGSVAQSAVDAKTVASDQSYLALIDSTTQDTGWANVPGPAGLPVFCGSQTGNGFECQSQPTFFPTGNTVIAGVYGQTLLSKILNKPNWAVVYCSELAACAQAVPLNKGFAKQQGVSVVFAEAASTTAPDYTAQCLGLKNANAQVVFGYAGGTTIAGNCAQQGYNPTWMVAQGALNSVYRKNSHFNGAMGPFGVFPFFQATTPAQKDFMQAMAPYWPNFDSFTTPYDAAVTWAALQFFATAAANAAANPTRQEIFNGVYSLPPNFTLGGLIPPETVVKGKPTINPCFYYVGITNGQWSLPLGDKLYCQAQT
jgi:branched-chain amino acid transport system substrate-binding protein